MSLYELAGNFSNNVKNTLLKWIYIKKYNHSGSYNLQNSTIQKISTTYNGWHPFCNQKKMSKSPTVGDLKRSPTVAFALFSISFLMKMFAVFWLGKTTMI